MKEKILQVEKLEVGFEENKVYQRVLNQISFDVYEGEVLGIVGESGSGKSITSLTIMDLLNYRAKVKHGTIRFRGEDLLRMSKEKKRSLRGSEIAMVFQEPMTSLNPLIRIGSQVEEVLHIHKQSKREDYRVRAMEMLRDVGLLYPEEIYDKYPHQLSGGMRQRVMIAMAMICKPKLLIADEPTTALDVTVQKQIVNLLKKINKEYGTTIIFISHDLGVIKSLCHRAIVMCEGDIVEEGTTKEIFAHPKEEYTKKLLRAVPRIRKEEEVQEQFEQEQVMWVAEVDSEEGNTLEQNMVDEKVVEQNGVVQVETDRTPILTVKDFSVYYPMKAKHLFGKAGQKEIVKGVSFTIKDGQIFGIVGESGSGKSTLAKAIVGLNQITAGELSLEVKHPQMVFQDPYSSLNPAKTIGAILSEPLKIHKIGSSKEQLAKVEEMLTQVGLPAQYAARHISELSGGQRQRVAIALALMTNQRFIVLDEPVSALDVTIQDQILKLLKELKKKYDLSYLFISHDLNVVYNLCDYIAVMKDGVIVEQGSRDDIYFSPQHEYTKQLLASML